MNLPKKHWGEHTIFDVSDITTQDAKQFIREDDEAVAVITNELGKQLAEALEVPERCQEVTLEFPTDDLIIVRYKCILSREKMRRLGGVLKEAADEA